MISILYIILSVLGLSFLVFIHELGHYLMARRVGMRVEAFSIGFGKPIISWMRKGVKWQIGWLPFGGYVRMGGMQKEGNLEPHEIPDGFFGKKPWDRIKVAFMGPFVNIAFAFLAFIAIWAFGGRFKPFSQFTDRIGYIDPKSELYEFGVRPGDEIVEYDGHKFKGFKDLLYAGIANGSRTQIKGYKLDYYTNERKIFDYTLRSYDDPRQIIEGLSTIGVLSPARYLIYDKLPNGKANPILENSPMQKSGIAYGDRLFWVDGELIFSLEQLNSIINEPMTFLTVQRGKEIIQTRAPRVKIADLNLSHNDKLELEDWQYESNLRGQLENLYFIPYYLTSSNIVGEHLDFIDEEMQKKAFLPCTRCQTFSPLKPGDRILAIDGKPVNDSFALLQNLQTKNSLIIVQGGETIEEDLSWKAADRDFNDSFHVSDLNTIVSSIGTDQPIIQSGNMRLLQPVVPKKLQEIVLSPSMLALLDDDVLKYKREAEKMQNPEQKALALHLLENKNQNLMLGIALQDKEVRYNPGPFVLFADVFEEIRKTFVGLFSGYVSPKHLAGPVGIVHAIGQSWMFGFKEALFWLGLISLNLGLLNLLPVPFLDGGHITFSFVEMITRRPLKAKTMEKLIIPFVVLIVGFFVYVTYHDLVRLLNFWK